MWARSNITGLCVLALTFGVQALHVDISWDGEVATENILMQEEAPSGDVQLGGPPSTSEYSAQSVLGPDQDMGGFISSVSDCAPLGDCDKARQCPNISNQTVAINGKPALHWCSSIVDKSNYIAGSKSSQPTIRACVSHGQSTPNCNGITYDQKTKECWLYKNALYTSRLVASKNPDFVAVLWNNNGEGITCPNVDNRPYTIEHRDAKFHCGKAIGGSESCTVAKADNVWECARVCSLTDRCVGADYKYAEKLCSLYNRGNSVIPPSKNDPTINSVVIAPSRVEVIA